MFIKIKNNDFASKLNIQICPLVDEIAANGSGLCEVADYLH